MYLCVYGELNRTPLPIKRKQKIISFWVRIESSNEKPLLTEIYNFLLSNDGNVPWIHAVKKILEESGKLDISDEVIGNTHQIYSDIKETIYKSTGIGGNPKLWALLYVLVFKPIDSLKPN